MESFQYNFRFLRLEFPQLGMESWVVMTKWIVVGGV